MAAKDGEKYNHLLEEQARTERDLIRVKDEEQAKLEEFIAVNDKLLDLDRQITAGTISKTKADLLAGGIVSANSEIVKHASGNVFRLAEALDTSRVAFASQFKMANLTSEALDGYAASVNEAEELTAELAARSKKTDERKATQDAKSRREQSAKDAKQKANDLAKELANLVKYRSDLNNKLLSLDASYSEKTAMETTKQIEDLKAKYDKILKLTSKNSSKRKEIEKALAEDLVVIRSIALRKTEKEYEKHSSEIQGQITDGYNNEVSDLEISTSEKLKIENEYYSAQIDQIIDAMGESETAFNKQEEALKNSLGKGSEELNSALAVLSNERLKTENDFYAKTTQLQEQNTSNNLAIETNKTIKIEEINKSLQDTLLGITTNGAEKSALAQLKVDQKLAAESFKTKVTGLKNSEALLLAFTEAQGVQRKIVEQNVIDELINIAGQYSNKVMEIDARLTGMREGKKKDRLTSDREYYVSLAELEAELVAVQKETAELSADQRLQAEQVVLNKIALLNKENSKRSINSIIKGFKRIQKSSKETGSKIQAIGSAFLAIAKGGDGAEEALVSLKDKAKEMFESLKDADLGSMFDSFLDKVKSFGKGALAVFASIGNGIKSLVSGFSSGLDFMTGGANLNPMSMIAEGGSAIQEGKKKGAKEKKALDTQLAKGEISVGEYDKAIASGVGEVDGTQIGSDFVQGVVDNAIDMIQAIASGAPAILQRLATEIPILINALVIAIPQLIETLATQLPVVRIRFN